MDYILTKINDELALCKAKDQDRYSLSRQRIEYSLMFLLGYLWNKHRNSLSSKEFLEIAQSFSNLTIGVIIGNLRRLDKDYEIFTKIDSERNKVINSYSKHRNNLYGHGYITNDDESAADIFNKIYKTLVEVDILKSDVDLIIVTGKEEDTYSGIQYGPDTGRPVRWAEKDFPYTADYIGNTFARYNNKYIKISPFVWMADKDKKILILTSLEDSLSGKINFARLLDTGREEGFVKEFAELSATDRHNREKSLNLTIRNSYTNNYTDYFPANKPVKDKLMSVLTRDNSTVTVTLWGHGGVGKTALVQNVIDELFNAPRQAFQYIVFASAKDKKYNTLNGKLERIEAGIRTFEDIIRTISKTLFEDVGENFEELKEAYEKRIAEIRYKALFVIDDYETLEDSEKRKIRDFTSKLDAHFHKVVITTRIKAANIGTEIITDELNQEDSLKFLAQIIKVEYGNEMLEAFHNLVENEKYAKTIYKSTSGRPIFLFQLAHIYARYGYNEEKITSFAEAPDARQYLYEGLYDYLTEKARLLFICISQIVDEQDYTFNSSHLQYLFSEYDSIETEMDELINMRVIECYSTLVYKVYSSEIYKMMNDKYKAYPDQDFKKRITERLKQVDLSAKNETIYETWLKQANASALYEPEEGVNENYRKLIDNNICPQYIREKALTSLANYYLMRSDRDGAIEVFGGYERIMRLWHDAVLTYVRVLDDNNKKCEILNQYFSEESKTDMKNLDLLSYLITARNSIAIKKELKHSELSKTYNENGLLLYKLAKEKHIFDEDVYADKIDIGDKLVSVEMIQKPMAIALSSSILILVHVLNTETNHVKLAGYKAQALEMCEFGKKYFGKYSTLLSDINRYELEIAECKVKAEVNKFDEFIQSHNTAEIYEFYITKVDAVNGYINGQIDRFDCSIPKWELKKETQEDLKKYYSKGNKLYVKIKTILQEKQQIHLKLV